MLRKVLTFVEGGYAT